MRVETENNRAYQSVLGVDVGYGEVASVAEVALLARWQVLHSGLIPCQQR